MKSRSKVVAGLPVECPRLFAVVDVVEDRVIARGLPEKTAEGFAAGYQGLNHRPAQIVEEQLNWPTDGQVLGQLQVAP